MTVTNIAIHEQQSRSLVGRTATLTIQNDDTPDLSPTTECYAVVIADYLGQVPWSDLYMEVPSVAQFRVRLIDGRVMDVCEPELSGIS